MPIVPDHNPDLSARLKKMFKCDTARISKPVRTMYLIIGWRRHTKDDQTSQWYRNGDPVDFEYLFEQVVARGQTEDDLITDAKNYLELKRQAESGSPDCTLTPC